MFRLIIYTISAATRAFHSQALACLDKAYAEHDFFHVFLKVHPWMDPLRSDSRFTVLVKKKGFPQT